MKKLVLSLLAVMAISLQAQASVGLKCRLVDDFDDWALEIGKNEAAFFDNDTVSRAKYVYSLEGFIDVYRSVSEDDVFTIEVNRYRPTLAIQTARLMLFDDTRRVLSYDFVCSDTDTFNFL